ncbi:MAG: tRNA (adenosine(37)-N6)-threonylcarbamoyltransferase complex ATPase subunit type 1 TsaE [Acidimicrobiia bacterium]
MSLRAATSSVDETRDLGAAVAQLARPGDVLVLAGDLGAGKTAFAQGFGRGLDVAGRITSPTFTLVHVYEGRLPIHHLDVYRLDQLAEVVDLGLAEMLDEGGVVLIEWGDAILPVLPPDFLEVRMTFGEGDDDRLVEMRPVGRGWSARERALVTALRPWSGGEGEGC